MRELLLGFVYFFVAIVAMLVSRETGNSVAVWPPNIIAVSIICRLNTISAWRALLACAVANFGSNFAFDVDFGLSVALAGVNFVQMFGCVALIQMLVLRRFSKSPELGFTFGFLGQMFGPLLISSLAGAAVVQHFTDASFQDVWLNWWAKETVAVLIFFGPILFFKTESLRAMSGLKWLEFFAVVAICFGVEHFLLNFDANIGSEPLILAFVWCAFRFQPFFTSVLGAFAVLFVTAELELLNDSGLSDTGSVQAYHFQIAVYSIVFYAHVLAHTVEHARNAKKKAEERAHVLATTNADMGTLLHIVSHDLKSPLMTIQGFSGLLQQYLASDQKERALHASNRIQEGARIMSCLIDDTLELSRVKHKRLRQDTIVLSDLVNEVKKLLDTKIRLNRVTIQNTGNNNRKFYGDRSKLIRALMNLVDNAIDYGCPQEGMRITIGNVDAGASTNIFVKDDGPGMCGADENRVFELFYRGNEDGDGTGAGLAIVKQVVDRHDGRVWVESDPKTGTCFWISLPKEPVTVPEESPSLPAWRSA